MAERLAKIYGTEEDKVNCPFYFKIGSCRHGDTCTRQHNKPPLAQSMVFQHLYDNPSAAVAKANGMDVPKEALVSAVRHFEDFFDEVFMQFANYGEIEDMVVADNIGDHMIGNLWVKFANEDSAKAAMTAMSGLAYRGKPIQAEFVPVTDFREAKCRKFTEGHCDRGGYCNFLHPKYVSRSRRKELDAWMYEEHPDYKIAKKERDLLIEANGGDEDKVRSRSRSRE
jgi:splicing factor U2AF subunit